MAKRDQFDTEFIEPTRSPLVRPQRIAFSSAGMVSTAHYDATRAGVEALRAGGNAIDAAVAAAFALGVCEPQASGLGGQTMLLVHDAASGRTVALDGSSRAPNRATPEQFATAKHRRVGYRAMTVPSTPAVLAYALANYGRLDLGTILEPAIRLAHNGVQVSDLQHALMRRERKKLRAGTAAPLFLRGGQRSYPAGAVLRHPALAVTLERLAALGIEDFYTGEIAGEILRDMLENDGLIQEDDLAQIPLPIERKPISTRFDGHRVLTFPPPAAGRALIEVLNVLDQLPDQLRDLDTPDGAVAFARVIRQAGIDRRDRPFDPNFYPQVDDKQMLKVDYARRVARRVRRALRGHGETTHLSVMDNEGNAVALTQSIESVFGSGVATPSLGFLYNNYISAFEHHDKGHPYFLRPNAVPWASVAPSIVFRGRRPWLVIGSPGSERIVSAIAQVMLRLKNHTPFEAVAAPRLHASVEGRLSLEASRFRTDIPRALVRHGFSIDARDPFSFYLGCVQFVLRDRRGLTGVADPRRDGSAEGPEE